ncbi:MAG TPA: HIRAN domain-containing protein [Kofleriaceae bacterium]|nr:HIRAN domain-containing protein [Kofleriaceae bacterium]
MGKIDRLLVLWGEPVAGNRFVIGHLVRSGGQFSFWYDDDLTGAQARGFQRLPEFPELRRAGDPYFGRYLFALFAERIPAPTRPDFAAMMVAWGVEHPDDQFEVLARSGGIRATDRLELAEYRAPHDDLSTPLEFRVAGRRYIPDVAPLHVEDTVSLRREPDNMADPAAVIVDREGRRAGYVPRQYAQLVGSFLDRGGPLEAKVVRELLVPDDTGKWVVRVASRQARR